jgi:hypothetical protein
MITTMEVTRRCGQRSLLVMTDHLRRLRRFMDADARLLAALAHRARVLDHKSNRGTEAENALASWLRERVEPEFTVSAGEVIDSFRTNVERDSRQHDVIVHRNTRLARRYTLQSGLRLVPIESVASVIEVKLLLDDEKFRRADEAATETASLRLRTERHRLLAGAGGPISTHVDAAKEDGYATEDVEMRGRVSFVLFAFSGPKKVKTLLDWLGRAKTIQAICCLSAGTVWRAPTSHDWPPKTPPNPRQAVLSKGALPGFLSVIDGSIERYTGHAGSWPARYTGYTTVPAHTYWDETGFIPRPGYEPMEEEVQALREAKLIPEDWTPPPKPSS